MSLLREEPVHVPNFTEEVIKPLKQARDQQVQKCKAQRGRWIDFRCQKRVNTQPKPIVVQKVPEQPTVQPVFRAYSTPQSGLNGSIGYAQPYGNCVNEPGVNNPGYGNPSSWPATSNSPWIGATALWPYDHVGVVTGIWDNGDLEIRHQNWQGGQHRFPISTFRGFR